MKRATSDKCENPEAAAHNPHRFATTFRSRLKFVSGVSLATTFDGEFSDVTRSYAGRRVARHACWRRTSGVWHLTDVDVTNVRFAPILLQKSVEGFREQ